jgi:carboxyl-terminal processing protease
MFDIRKHLRLRSLGLLAAIIVALASGALAQTQDKLASAQQLRLAAFEALKRGDFDQSSGLLARAAQLNPDRTGEQLADWARQFDAQRQQFAEQRRKEYDKEVANVRLLVDKGHASYAIDYASRAYLLADDKKAFREQAWAADLLRDAIAAAKKCESDEQWFKAVRIYSDLAAIEPSNAQWKERLKTATRRIRLLAVYSNDGFRRLQEAESREREQIDQIVSPTTRPATAATRPEENGNFKLDWRDMLKGVRMDMLREAVKDAVENYYRDVSYKQVALGGLRGLRVVLTTRGLETAFAGLRDEAKKNSFLNEIDNQTVRIAALRGGDVTKRTVDEMLLELQAINGQTVALPDEVLVNEFADGAFAELDAFTNVIWPYDLEEFQKTTKGEFSGVGIQIQSDDDGSLRVVSPLEDSPAFKAGIKAGDIITHINGKGAKGIVLTQAVKQITGPPRTTVTLTIRSLDGTSRDVVLVRETIKVPSVKGWIHKPGGGWDWFIDNQQKIAYVRMTNFTATTGDELEKAFEELSRQDARGAIFDLRYNPGGLLAAATEVADRFIERGVIVSTRPDRQTPHQRTRTDADPLKDKIKLPIVVLVNQLSASASEIVAGALKDHHRAVIVGERTFGKGSVQMLFPLAGKTAYLKLTTSHYYLPSDRCIHREEDSTQWGVDPDVKVEMTPEQMRRALDARSDQDVLRAIDGGAIEPAPTTRKARDPLSADSQLGAALLVMRIQLASTPAAPAGNASR